MPYGIIEFVSIGSGNDLLLDSTKPLPEAMWTNQLCHSPEKKITQNAWDIDHVDMSVEIQLLI